MNLHLSPLKHLLFSKNLHNVLSFSSIHLGIIVFRFGVEDLPLGNLSYRCCPRISAGPLDAGINGRLGDGDRGLSASFWGRGCYLVVLVLSAVMPVPVAWLSSHRSPLGQLQPAENLQGV